MSDAQHHAISLPTNFAIFAALLVLLFLTIGAAFLDLGMFGVPIAFTIATIKAVLILMYFMHVRFSNRLTQLFSTAAGFWVLILLVFTFSDYLSRGWLNVVGK